MLILRSVRVLTKLTQNHVKCFNYVLCKRDLRSLSRRKVEFLSLPAPIDQKVDEVEEARRELAQLTGGLNEQQLKEILEKPKSKDSPQPKAVAENETSLEASPEKHSALAPTYNLAAYVNESPTLQQFIHLGVNLSSIERRKGLAQFVLRLDFKENVQPYLLFLRDQGVPAEAFGEMITKNPLLFKLDLDDMQVRINYLEAKKFDAEQRKRILIRNPFWIMFSTRRIDRRLGHFQQEFRLSGDDVRFLATKQPRLITYNMEHIRKSTFCIREEMGFDADEMKCLLLSKPRLWMIKSDDLVERFAYAHQEMKLSHHMLIQFPEVLISREFRLRQRHEFLKMLGRAQYNPEMDLYISPKTLVEGNDFQFVRNVAKSDIKTYELFLKTR